MSDVIPPKKVSDSPSAPRDQKLFRVHPRTPQLFLRDKRDSTARATPYGRSLCQTHLCPGLASASDPVQANLRPRRIMQLCRCSGCMENFSMIWAWLGVEESTGPSWEALWCTRKEAWHWPRVMSSSFCAGITASSCGPGDLGSHCQFPHVQLRQKRATKLCPLPAGCLPSPRQWKEIPPRGVPLPAPRLEGYQGTAGCPPPSRSLAMGSSSILPALSLPMSFPQVSFWECFSGWWLKTGIIIPWNAGIVQKFLLRKAAAHILSK